MPVVENVLHLCHSCSLPENYELRITNRLCLRLYVLLPDCQTLRQPKTEEAQALADQREVEVE